MTPMDETAASPALPSGLEAVRRTVAEMERQARWLDQCAAAGGAAKWVVRDRLNAAGLRRKAKEMRALAQKDQDNG